MTTIDDPVTRAFELLDDLERLNSEFTGKLQALSDAIGTAVPREAGGAQAAAFQGPPAGVAGEGLPPASLPPAGELRFERLVTADSMEAGGAVRLPLSGSPNRWREIHSVSTCSSSTPCRQIAFRDGSDPVHVSPFDTLPYLTPAEWAEDEPESSKCIRVTLCVLDDGHAGDCVDEQGQTYQGWAA